MKTTTKLWHMLIITLALLITACGGNSESAGSGGGGFAVTWDYETCSVSPFVAPAIPYEEIEENLYAGQSVIKQGAVDSFDRDLFQFSLQESGTITVSIIGALKGIVLSANDCTKLPLTGEVIKGPYFVSVINTTFRNSEYTAEISLE